MNKNILMIISEFFYVLTGSLVVFSLLEMVWSGVVLAYINLNWVLILWLFAGIIVLINPIDK